MTNLSARRIGAMVLRHLYILRGSWPRVMEMAYWPAINMVVWGFTSQFFSQHSHWVAQAGGVLIGAVILWDVMFRGNLGVSLSFMEEMWSRNLGHLSVSPLRPHELVVAMLTMSLIR
ncbi:MAG: ABC transporter permease, partial [Magnetospirillum sp.]|nr:ABC transporter permease [Magnetospirillum sp.]